MGLALALILGQALQPASPEGPIFTNPATMGRYAFFEAFPQGGAGTTTACSTTPPTGAKGEVLTFARTGNATCTKTATGGLSTSGIANGDLVVMSSNQPRVEYDSVGTLGLLVESSRINAALRSQEFDNAAWTASGVVSAPPTVTANYAVAPDGTATAERVQFASCAGVGDRSVLFQTLAANGVSGQSIYLRGTSGSGSISICYGNTPGSCSQCAFVAGSWSRCTRVTSAPAVGTYFFIGCTNETAVLSGAMDTGAADVLVWGAQLEAGPYATSYIPTTSAAVTRNVETASFAGPAITTTSCMFANVQFAGMNGGSQSIITQFNTVANYYELRSFSSQTYSTTSSNNSTVAGVLATGSVYRLGTYNSAGDVRETCRNGTCTATATATSYSRPASSLHVGSIGGGGFADAIISRICLDPSPTRCR